MLIVNWIILYLYKIFFQKSNYKIKMDSNTKLNYQILMPKFKDHYSKLLVIKFKYLYILMKYVIRLVIYIQNKQKSSS